MLATEHDEPGTTGRQAVTPLLETWQQNEVMRHIPSAPWMLQKLDRDVRRRIDSLWVPFSDLAASDPRHGPLEAEFRALARWLDRVAEVARRGRSSGHPPNDLGPRVQWSLSQAVGALAAVDAYTFGKRLPFQTFERSNAESLWAAVLSVVQHVQRIVPMVREIEPEIDERMLEGLVNLTEPLRREPIA
jgi:hypothetical protein